MQDVRFEEDRALRESLERKQIAVPQMEELLAPKEETQVGSQTESQTRGKRATQQDAKEDDKLSCQETQVRV